MQGSYRLLLRTLVERLQKEVSHYTRIGNYEALGNQIIHLICALLHIVSIDARSIH